MKNFGNGTITKKSGLLWAVLLCVFFSACVPAPDEPEPVKTTLTISNDSSITLLFPIRWNETEFSGMYLGDKETEVDAGSGYIFFSVYLRKVNVDELTITPVTLSGRTKDLVTIEKGEAKTFVFTDSTLVVDENNNTCTLLAFVNR
jgi:hypothetical protein